MKPTVLLVVALGCNPPDPAPEDLEDLVRFTFTHYDEDEEGRNDRSLADAAANMAAWTEANVADIETGHSATLEHRLTDEDLSVLSPAPAALDGPAALGVLVMRRLPCTLALWEDLYLIDDQSTVFPDSYVSYARRNRDGAECWEDGSCGQVRWEAAVQKEESLLGVEYSFDIASGIRRTEAAPVDADEPFPARFSRTWMLAPAEISNPDLGDFRQNYQLESVWPSGDGIVSAYAFWTELASDTLLTESNPFVQGYIDGLEETHDIMAAWCEERR
jgi:hypothetical protein